MRCKICDYQGSVFHIEIAYTFEGGLDSFGIVTSEGQAVASTTTVRCPECNGVMPTLHGDIDNAF